MSRHRSSASPCLRTAAALLFRYVVSIVVALAVWLGNASGIMAGPLDPGTLAVYYGYPSLVNGASFDIASAAAVFGAYDTVVFSGGLEEPGHADHSRTAQIIGRLHADHSTRIFGYMDAPNWGRNWTATGAAPADWSAHLDQWRAMGVDGVFVDRFGYDWGITRTMQNGMFDAIHERGLRAFVNSWFIDHTFSRTPDPGYPWGNPAGVPSHIQPADLYLLESFTIAEGNYVPCAYPDAESWLQKADKASRYRPEFGVEMWTLATADALSPVAAAATGQDVDPRLSYAWYAAGMYGFDGFGWAEPQFSASGAMANLLPWRPRPAPNAPSGTGSQFLGQVVHGVDTHRRDTDLGQFRVICRGAADRYADFVSNGLATPEPTSTATATSTMSPTPTETAAPTPSPTPTATPTETITPTPSPTPTATPTETITPTPSPTPTATPTETITPTPSPTPTATPMATATPFDSTDSDGDGLPDVYEVQHTCLHPSVADAEADPDGDGQTNSAEYVAGADPCTCRLLHDWDADDEISVNDVLLMLPLWQATPTSAGWIPGFDIDSDGIITLLDFMTVVNEIGRRCPGLGS